MKIVKVIKNSFPDDEFTYNIDKFIGKEFEVIEEYDNGEIYVDFLEDKMLLFPGEFEVIE